MTQHKNRRLFLKQASLLSAGTLLGLKNKALPVGMKTPEADERIIDIHQHTNYHDRSNDNLLIHQREMGITTTILLPAGHVINYGSTHYGVSNGLQAKCTPNEACYQFAKEHPKEFLFAANEVPDAPNAIKEIEKYLKLGAVMIAELKFNLECDSPEMQKIYQLAQAYDVPVLMHWQFKMYSMGFEKLPSMLKKYKKVTFIGHAQTWWANIDKQHPNQNILYPKGKVTPGGYTDRWLKEYDNLYADLSAGSGLSALTRDEDFTRDFIQRHQDKLLYGSDCADATAKVKSECQGFQTIAAVKKLSPSKEIERKLLFENAKRVLKLKLD